VKSDLQTKPLRARANQSPASADSYLPPELIRRAQAALFLYGLHIDPNPEMMADEASA